MGRLKLITKNYNFKIKQRPQIDFIGIVSQQSSFRLAPLVVVNLQNNIGNNCISHRSLSYVPSLTVITCSCQLQQLIHLY